jgi:hypothetical protein
MMRLEFVIAVVLDRLPKVLVIPKEASAFDILCDHFEDVGLGVLNGFYFGGHPKPANEGQLKTGQ